MKTSSESLKFLSLIVVFFLCSIILKAQNKVSVFISQNRELSFKVENPVFFISISRDGNIRDYSFLVNGDVRYDIHGRIEKVGEVAVTYNIHGQIEKIGNEQISFDFHNRLSRIGDTIISYDIHDRLESVGEQRISYDIHGRVEKIL